MNPSHIVREGRRALLQRLLSHGTATADDVRRAVPLPPGINPKAFGSVPGPLVRAGVIAPVGFSPSHRSVAHRRNLTVWTLADRAAAVRYLITDAS